MTESRQYDTVAFDVRDNATMLFFAKTTDAGDINDYLLLMRTVDDDFDVVGIVDRKLEQQVDVGERYALDLDVGQVELAILEGFALGYRTAAAERQRQRDSRQPSVS